MKENAMEQIRNTADKVYAALAVLQKTLRVSQEKKAPWFNETLEEELKGLIAKLEKSHQDLCQPCLKIAFVGTTSSGKSTLLNGLSGHRIAPMEAGEMSAGVVRIADGSEMSMRVLETPNMAWQAGSYEVNADEEIYRYLRDKDTGIMEKYWQASGKNREVMAPQIEITAQLAPKHGGIPRFHMHDSLGLEFYDLPGLKTVTDARNLQVIQKYLGGSFLLVVLNYSDTDGEKRRKLLTEIKKTVDGVCKNKEALLFILNRIDERNSDDDPLELRVSALQRDIQTILELQENPAVIPMSALSLYHLQTAWGAEKEPIYQKGLAQKSKEHLESFFRDCAKSIEDMRESEEKDDWFSNHTRRNIDKWEEDDIPQLLGWVYEYSGASQFWETLQKKLDDQIGAVVINPAVGEAVSGLEEFSKRLQGVLSVLQIGTEEEIKTQKLLVESLSKNIKKKLQEFKEQFSKDFSASVRAVKSGEAARISRSKYAKEFGNMRDVMFNIKNDVHDTIMMPIRNCLLDCDVDKIEDMEEQLREVIPPELARNIRRALINLLTRGYIPEYAQKGLEIHCRTDKKDQDKNKEKIDLINTLKTHCGPVFESVDKALQCRSQLLLQERIHFFSDTTEKILSVSTQALSQEIKEKLGDQTLGSILAAVSIQKKREVTLPDRIFDIKVEEAKTRMEKVTESY